MCPPLPFKGPPFFSLFKNITSNAFFSTSGKDFMLDAIDVLKGVRFSLLQVSSTFTSALFS